MYKVFIVDDEPFILSGLQDILDWEQLGLAIVGQAENGQEALEQLREVPADILITDISMPVMTGLELIRAVREFRPELKVVVLSGYDEFIYVKEGLSLGIENYLLKPINLEEFRSTLETIVEKLDVSRLGTQWWEYTNSVLKDNVLLRWMRGQIDPEERSERLNLIGLPLGGRYVQVALVQAEPATEAFRKNVEELVGAQTSFFMFWDSDNDLVLIHNYEEASKGAEQMAVMLQEITGLCATGQGVRAAVGSAVEGVDAAPFSYEQAKQTQEFMEIHPARSLIYYEQLKDRKEDLGAVLPEDWSEYSKLIMGKNLPALTERIELYFSGKAMESLTPELLREISLEWILYFRMLIKEIRSEMERELIAQGLTAIHRTNSLPGLSAAVMQTAGSIIELLDRELKSPVVNQVLNYIEKSYSEDLSLKKLGFMFNIHPVYLGQLFHKMTGESFAEYMNRYRIEKAKEQLRSTNNKVHEIARSVGYWEMGYFYKQFKKYVGISPTEFKGLL
ncbi:response regulator transcription factor [Paenibacillus sp. FSL R7-0312]|uniref:response regulator transcription factor n=1 Tax=unclassified Paenibacillus TaxID=185978 RepID=UPI0004F8A70C|nr:response regulator transcription factor [Paenibacillus sp. FSL R5-0912]AIQ42771.1 response regulator [Paenibacillus sp. FSL R5-0912]